MSREVELAAIFRRTQKVTGGQLAEHWGVASRAGRRRLDGWLDDLVSRRILRRYMAHVKPTPPFAAPLYVGTPGRSMGERAASELSWRLEERWATAPMPTAVYCAGPRIAAAYGGRARQTLGNLSAISHDCGLARLFLRFVRERPDLARAWVPDFLREPPGYREKQPDVLLCDGSGAPYRCVELGGTYPPSRLLDLDWFCLETLQLPLEIW